MKALFVDGESGRWIRFPGAGLHDLDSRHQPPALHAPCLARMSFLQREQAFTENGVERRGVGQVAALPERPDIRQRRGDRQGRAGMRRCHRAGGVELHDVGAPDHRGQRKGTGDALAAGDEVGDDAIVLEREPSPGPAETRLHFVHDEKRVILPAPRLEAFRVGDGEKIRPHSLEALRHDSAHLVRGHSLFFQRLQEELEACVGILEPIGKGDLDKAVVTPAQPPLL